MSMQRLKWLALSVVAVVTVTWLFVSLQPSPPPPEPETFKYTWLLWLLGATAAMIAGELLIKHFALDGRVRYAAYGLAGVLAITGIGQLLGGANPFTGWLTPFMQHGEVQWPQVIGALVVLTVGGFGAWDLMKDKSSRQTSRRVAIALAVGAILFGLLDWLLGSYVRDLLIEYVRGEAQTVVRDRIITNQWEWWHLGAALVGAIAIWAFFAHGWLRNLLVVISVITGLGVGVVYFKDYIFEVIDVGRDVRDAITPDRAATPPAAQAARPTAPAPRAAAPAQPPAPRLVQGVPCEPGAWETLVPDHNCEVVTFGARTDYFVRAPREGACLFTNDVNERQITRNVQADGSVRISPKEGVTTIRVFDLEPGIQYKRRTCDLTN